MAPDAVNMGGTAEAFFRPIRGMKEASFFILITFINYHSPALMQHREESAPCAHMMHREGSAPCAHRCREELMRCAGAMQEQDGGQKWM